jgi:hypothetical protein
MSYREPSYKEIIISKVITVIFVLYLIASMIYVPLFKFLIWIGTNAQGKYSNRHFGSYEYSQLLLYFGIFFFQLFLIKQLWFPKSSKFYFANFNRGFHPIYAKINGENLLQIGLIRFFVTALIFGLIIYNLDITKERLVFNAFIFINIWIYFIILNRKEELKSFPVEFVKSSKIRLQVKYLDYINHKIADDEPHLTINQNFDVSIKSLPRNDSEKNLIEIKNPNTPINPALVYNIKDKDLADTLRNGYILKAKLIAIKEEGNLEIELSLKKTSDFKEDEITEFIK